jgi:D-lactate dehydrogenase
LLTSHQAFLTDEALEKIAQVTLQNIFDFESGKNLNNVVRIENLIKK